MSTSGASWLFCACSVDDAVRSRSPPMPVVPGASA